MLAPRLLDRYHTTRRTLEFDLSDAPLVDAVVEATVLSTHACSLLDAADPRRQHRGLFYGKDTFVFDRPFVFDCDQLTLLCWLRIREYDPASLLTLATGVVSHTFHTNTLQCDPKIEERNCLVRFSAFTPIGLENSEYVYFMSEATVPTHRPPDVPSASDSPKAQPDRCLSDTTTDDVMLLLSATALCLE